MPSANNGGVQRIMAQLVNKLKEFKYQIVFLIADGKGEMIDSISKEIEIKDFKIRLGRGDIKTILSLFKVCKFLKNDKPDVLCAAPGFSTVISVVSKKITRSETKVAIMVDNKLSTLKKGKIKHRISYYIYKKIYPYADAIIVAHEQGYKDIVKTFKVEKKKVYKIYHPLINEKEIESAEKPNHIWYQNNEKVILSVGRLVKEKDFPTMLKAFYLYKKANSNCKLLILGEGPERKNLENMIKKYHLESSVQLYGYVNNPYSFMKYSEMFVLTSSKEAFGNVIVEALATGTQVIATDCDSGGPREILSDGKYGILCKCGDANQIADAMNSITHKRFNTKELEERGKSFSIKNSAKSYNKVFKDIVKEV